MQIDPDNKVIVWPIIFIVSFNLLMLYLFIRDETFYFFNFILFFTIFNVSIIYFTLREFKSFTLNGNILIIKYYYLVFLLPPIVINLDNIISIKIIRYTHQIKNTPIMIVNSNDGKKKSIHFRLEERKNAVQDLINRLREQQILIECEGDVWT